MFNLKWSVIAKPVGDLVKINKNKFKQCFAINVL